MPFPRRTTRYRRNTRYRRRPTYRYKKKSVYNIAKKAAIRVANQRMDKKTYFIEGTGSISDSGVMNLFPMPAKGTGTSNREGDDIWVLSTEYRIRVSTPENDDCVRVIFVQWMEYIDSVVTFNNIAENLFVSGSTNYYMAPFNSQLATKYRVLYDRCFNIDADNKRSFDVHKVFKNLPIKKLHFENDDGSTGSYALSKGMVICLMISNSAIAPHPAYEVSSKVNFYDN